MRALLILAQIAAGADLAIAQGAAVGTEKLEYTTVAQALETLRAKPGVNISVRSGWTVIEDSAALSVWSFTPSSHRAHPTAIQRKVVQEGRNTFVKMNVLCEASKPDCDAVTAEFGKLNERVRNDLAPALR